MESKGVTLSPCPHDDESKKSTETISILVVDDDTACLAIVAAILKKFKYEVVTVKHADDALCTLRIKGGAFDLVVSDVHMPDMNGFELQQAIAQEFNNLPVVLMSADPKEGVALRGLENGAAFFIYKPVCPDDVRDLWQFAALRKPEPSQVTIHNEVEIKKDDCNEIISVSSNDSDKKSPRNEGMETFTQAGGPSQKKPKIIWTNSLHNRFLEAIRSIGLERAVPKKILEVMNVPGLTRENVASHLQKYRIFLRRVSDASYKVQYSADHKRFSSSSSSIGNIFTTPSSLTLNRFPYQKPGGSGQYSPAAAAGLLGQSRRLTLPNTGIKLNFSSPLMGPTTSTYNNNNNNSVPSNVMKTTPPSNNYSGYSSAVNLKRLTGTTTTVVEPSNANIADDAFVVGNNNNNNNRNGDQVSNFIGDYRVNQLSNSNPSLRFDNGGGLINREPTYSPMFDMFDLEALSTPRPLDQGHFHTTLADQVNMLNQAQNEGENFTNANFYGDTSLWGHNSIPSFDQPPNLQQQNFSLDLVKPQELGANNSTAQVNNTILLPTNERDDDEFLDSLLAPYGEDQTLEGI